MTTVLPGRRSCLALAAGLLAGLAAGCVGGPPNPTGPAPLLPPGSVVSTQAKPAAPNWLAGLVPQAVRVEVRPPESTCSVRTQQVLVATVYDAGGHPLRNRRVEWMVEGAGNIVEADEGVLPGTSAKVSNQYAVTYTDCFEHNVTRGNDDPRDDFMIRPGQSWCVISSAVEGDTHVTVYCPEVPDWDAHQVHVSQHWVDAEWALPRPAAKRTGSEQPLATSVFRHSDRQPLAGYRVRYKVLDGPPAHFLPDRAQEVVTASDLGGSAAVTLAQVAPATGVNRIGVEIIRPPDPSLPAGAGFVVGRGEIAAEWQGPQVVLCTAGPPTIAVGAEVPYTITVTNTGKFESRGLTVYNPIPESLEYVGGQPPAKVEGAQLVWTLGELPPGQARTIQAVFRSSKVSHVTSTARVVTDEGLKDEKSVVTEVAAPQLKVTKAGPTTGVIGVPVAYEITVTNPGGGPATNVLLKDDFDAGLEHDTKSNQVELPLGTLAAGQSRVVKLQLTPRKTGTLASRVTATADGGLSERAEHTVTIQEPKLQVKVSGPAARYVGRPAVWEIHVVNPGEAPLADAVVRCALPPEVTFATASDGGKADIGQVVWDLGTLKPGQGKVVQVAGRCVKMAARAVTVATATAGPGQEARDESRLEVRGLPAFRLEVYDQDDPVEVNGKTTYRIGVTNQGSLPGNQVAITATVPPQLKVLSASGPSPHRIDGQKVIFPPVDGLAPKLTLSYAVEVQAVQPGDARFVVELRSDTLSAPVVEEESTNVYTAAAASGTAAASVPPPVAPVPASEPLVPVPQPPAPAPPDPAPAPAPAPPDPAPAPRPGAGSAADLPPPPPPPG